MKCNICGDKIKERDSQGVFKTRCEKEVCKIKARNNIGKSIHPRFGGDADTGLRN